MIRFSPCKWLLVLSICLPAYSQPQIGGGTCTNATLNGTYYYVAEGNLISGNTVYPVAELVKAVADGQGNVSGSGQASIGGALATYSVTGTYSVQSNCSGTLALILESGVNIAISVAEQPTVNLPGGLRTAWTWVFDGSNHSARPGKSE
jgi:hypothetical protein